MGIAHVRPQALQKLPRLAPTRRLQFGDWREFRRLCEIRSLYPNCPPATPEMSEFLERWSAPQARSETLSKIGARLRRPKRCLRVDAAACPRFSGG